MQLKFLIGMAVTLASITLTAQKSPVFAPHGIAIRGYDPVAFFTESRPVAGSDSLRFSWQGVEWHFISTGNLEMFRADPERYAPQFGGYCAYGTADGHKAPTEVETWTIVNGKLYFNYNKKVQQYWNRDRPALISKAEKNWPAIKDNE